MGQRSTFLGGPPRYLAHILGASHTSYNATTARSSLSESSAGVQACAPISRIYSWRVVTLQHILNPFWAWCVCPVAWAVYEVRSHERDSLRGEPTLVSPYLCSPAIGGRLVASNRNEMRAFVSVDENLNYRGQLEQVWVQKDPQPVRLRHVRDVRNIGRYAVAVYLNASDERRRSKWLDDLGIRGTRHQHTDSQ